jgi:tRNA-splicing endonuclease subunit Sen34
MLTKPDLIGPMDTQGKVRISHIANRYLVFDYEEVEILRRQENTCGNLVGTAPQQPSQNIFLGLPIELRPEEAEALVQRGAAYIVDAVAAHQNVLCQPGSSATDKYIQFLRQRKVTASKMLQESSAEKASNMAKRRGRPADASTQIHRTDSAASDEVDQPEGNAPKASLRRPEGQGLLSLGVTATSSRELISPEAGSVSLLSSPPANPLCRFLQNTGYYMTPGLRFGSQYSVYPGDPLRYHAHFMATSHSWDEKLPVLDLIAGGRLATAVKKSYLIGGQMPGPTIDEDGPVITYSIEWASM